MRERVVAALICLLLCPGVFVGGYLYGMASDGLDDLTVVEVPEYVVTEKQCPAYVPHTPMTAEELAGLAQARDLDAHRDAEVERLLRQEIADLKARLEIPNG